MLKSLQIRNILLSPLQGSPLGIALAVQLAAFCLSPTLTTGDAQAEPETSTTTENSEILVQRSAAIARLLPNQLLLGVQGMVCGMCVQGITKQIQELDGVSEVEIDLEAGSVLVTASSRQRLPSAAQLRTAVMRAGYEVQEIHRASTSEGE